eukprot:3632551-Prymnesium_polylepis.2
MRAPPLTLPSCPSESRRRSAASSRTSSSGRVGRGSAKPSPPTGAPAPTGSPTRLQGSGASARLVWPRRRRHSMGCPPSCVPRPPPWRRHTRRCCAATPAAAAPPGRRCCAARPPLQCRRPLQPTRHCRLATAARHCVPLNANLGVAPFCSSGCKPW